MIGKNLKFTLLISFFLVSITSAEDLNFVDPVGDDKGPGNYIYPSDPVYKPGSFDITKVTISTKGSDVEFKVTVNSKIEDPWDSKQWGRGGFSVQMVQIYIDQDHIEKSGVRQLLPGINATFVPESYYEKCIIISPQSENRLKSEINEKASEIKDKIIIPKTVQAMGKTITAVVSKEQLGGEPKKSWGYQFVMQSNEGFPDKTDLLTRKVNEFEGQHRFGGGTDYDCDPHIMDIIVSPAKGEEGEAKEQYTILSKYKKCTEKDTTATIDELVALPMVYLEGKK